METSICVDTQRLTLKVAATGKKKKLAICQFLSKQKTLSFQALKSSSGFSLPCFVGVLAVLSNARSPWRKVGSLGARD